MGVAAERLLRTFQRRASQLAPKHCDDTVKLVLFLALLV